MDRPQKLRRIWFWGIMVCWVAPAVTIGFFGLTYYAYATTPSVPVLAHLPFDGKSWRAWDEVSDDSNYTRGRMLRSLLREYPLVGMSEAQVVDLLGPPDTSYSPAYAHPSPHSYEYCYSLGCPPEPFSIFCGSDLVLAFEPEGDVCAVTHRAY